MIEERELRTAIKLLSSENNEVVSCGKTEDVLLEPAIRSIRYYLERLEDLTTDELLQIHTLTGLIDFLCSQPLKRLFPKLTEENLVLETDSNSAALTGTGKPTDAFLSLFEEDLSVRDESQKIFRELITALRKDYPEDIESDLPRYQRACEKYSRFREFFNAEHTFGTHEGLLSAVNAKGVDVALFNRYFKRVYRSLGNLRRHVRCCPYCGRIADKHHYQDYPYCGDLHRELQRPYIEHIFNGTKEVFIMHDDYIEDTVLPNLVEELFENELSLNDSIVKSFEKSPDVDRYDFFITLHNGTQYLVDNKDYRSAKKLIEYYKNKSHKVKDMRRPKAYFSEARGNGDVVISDIRVAISPNNYLNDLTVGLEDLGLKVATIKEFIDIIKKEGGAI